MRLALGRFPGGLLGMVSLVLAVEWGIARNEQRFYGAEAWDWRIQGLAGNAHGAPGEVLLLGDSQLKFGLSSLLLARQLGQSVRTIAPGGCNPAGHYYLLKRAIDRGETPAAVVVDFMPALLLTKPLFSEPRWADLLTARDAADLAWTLRDPGALVRVLLNKLAPSVRDRHEIRAAITELVHGKWVDKRPSLQKFAWNHEKNRGNMLLPEPAAPPASADCQLWRSKLYPQAWACRRVNSFFMRKFFALAAEHAIPVYWLLFPACPELQRAFESAGDDSRYGKLVAELAGEQSNVVVLDARRSGYDSTAFFDPIHLNARGNECLSASVSACLANRGNRPSAGERWVLLPQYSPEDSTLRFSATREARLERQRQARKTRGL